MSDFISFRDLGKERANPYAVWFNNLKLDDCPCTEAQVCEDILTSATIDQAEVITQAVFNGNTYLPGNDVKSLNGELILEAPGTITAADTAELQEWLEAIASIYEFDPYIEVTHDQGTTTLTIKHYGALTLTSVSTDAPETITGTQCCSLFDMFTNTISIAAGNIVTITVDGVDCALADGTYPLAADATVLEGDIETCLTTLGVTFSSVTVTFDVPDDEHDVVIISTGRVIAFDGVEALNTASSEQFVCA